MRIQNNLPPKSSFLSLDKDMSIITDKVFKNTRLQKLLYYTTKDALERPELTDEQKLELWGKNIKNLPRLYVDKDVLNYILINFDNFAPTSSNPYFRDNLLYFDILCHFDQWVLKDFQLRPYRIAAEIDSMFNNFKLSGLGTLEFIGANQIVTNNEFAGFSLTYKAVHGDEDKKFMPNPEDEAKFIEQFNKDFNS